MTGRRRSTLWVACAVLLMAQTAMASDINLDKKISDLIDDAVENAIRQSTGVGDGPTVKIDWDPKNQTFKWDPIITFTLQGGDYEPQLVVGMFGWWCNATDAEDDLVWKTTLTKGSSYSASFETGIEVSEEFGFEESAEVEGVGAKADVKFGIKITDTFMEEQEESVDIDLTTAPDVKAQPYATTNALVNVAMLSLENAEFTMTVKITGKLTVKGASYSFSSGQSGKTDVSGSIEDFVSEAERTLTLTGRFKQNSNLYQVLVGAKTWLSQENIKSAGQCEPQPTSPPTPPSS